MTPNDPLYANQWHLRMLGNIEAIWNDYTGFGIHVGVYDFGVDYRHSDLRTRYDASRHVVIDGRTHIPDPDDRAATMPTSSTMPATGRWRRAEPRAGSTPCWRPSVSRWRTASRT